jgi:hypothetical protein
MLTPGAVGRYTPDGGSPRNGSEPRTGARLLAVVSTLKNLRGAMLAISSAFSLGMAVALWRTRDEVHELAEGKQVEKIERVALAVQVGALASAVRELGADIRAERAARDEDNRIRRGR